ncbi:MAG: NUDIX hydrolase [Patescibacteria group bacterium]
MEDLIQNEVVSDNGATIYIWHENRILENLPVWQVYGFCLMSNGTIPLVRDKNEKRFTFPGGRVDEGENPEEALIREFVEEVQFQPEKIKPLGSLEVIVKDINGNVINHHQQIRFICYADEAGEFIPYKNNFEVEERIFVKPEKLIDYISWLKSVTGQAQYQSFLKNK